MPHRSVAPRGLSIGVAASLCNRRPSGYVGRPAVERRRKGPGGPTGLQNRLVPPSGGRKVRLLPFSANPRFSVPSLRAKYSQILNLRIPPPSSLGKTCSQDVPSGLPAKTFRPMLLTANPALAAEVNLDHVPELLGEMERLRAILWACLSAARSSSARLADQPARPERGPLPPMRRLGSPSP